MQSYFKSKYTFNSKVDLKTAGNCMSILSICLAWPALGYSLFKRRRRAECRVLACYLIFKLRRNERTDG